MVWVGGCGLHYVCLPNSVHVPDCWARPRGRKIAQRFQTLHASRAWHVGQERNNTQTTTRSSLLFVLHTKSTWLYNWINYTRLWIRCKVIISLIYVFFRPRASIDKICVEYASCVMFVLFASFRSVLRTRERERHFPPFTLARLLYGVVICICIRKINMHAFFVSSSTSPDDASRDQNTSLSQPLRNVTYSTIYAQCRTNFTQVDQGSSWPDGYGPLTSAWSTECRIL